MWRRNSKRVTTLGAMLSLLSLGACKPNTSAEKTDQSASADKAAAEQKAAEVQAAALIAPRPHSDVPLAARLAHEAENRPERALRVEEVFAAFRTDGVPLVSTRQVLAETLGASYCEMGVTNKGVALAVCEFEDPTAAERGRARSRAMFDKVIKNRVLTINGQTLLTVVTPTPMDTEGVVARFASL